MVDLMWTTMRRIVGAGAVGAALVVGSLMAASPGEAATVSPASISHAYVGGGRAGYNTANKHAWVCDSLRDGHSIYGVFHFAAGNTQYKFADTKASVSFETFCLSSVA